LGHPKTVTHPYTNQALHGVTLLIETKMLPQSHAAATNQRVLFTEPSPQERKLFKQQDPNAGNNRFATPKSVNV